MSLFLFQINPPHYIPLVEIVPAPWTEESVIERTMQLMRELGQSPVKLKKEVNGFIVNRLQYALIMEAWRLVEVTIFLSSLIPRSSHHPVFDC